VTDSRDPGLLVGTSAGATLSVSNCCTTAHTSSASFVYDALVGAVAAHHQVPLPTRDVRALRTYRAFDVDVVVIRSTG
jgi:hypothetical protein